MGTLAIIRELLVYIQGQSNPIYLAEQRERVMLPHLGLDRWRGWLLFSLLLSAPILTFIERQFGMRFSMYRDFFVLTVLIVVGGAVSMGWTVPLAMLAGQGISRERTAHTLPILMVTPYPTEAVLLAKAAASIHRTWKLVISLTFIASLPGLFIAGLIVISTVVTGQTMLLGVLYMGAGMVAIIAEREQEIALSVVVGIAMAFASDSRRVAMLLGLTGGVLIRLVQALATLILAYRLAPLASPNFALLNAAAGSATLLTIAPRLESVIVVAGMIAGREILIRALFAWSVRRAREG
jgi:hypothetical protein